MDNIRRYASQHPRVITVIKLVHHWNRPTTICTFIYYAHAQYGGRIVV